MPDIWMDVDTALAEVPVNILPLLDDVDFKSREVAIAYNAAGMDLVWNFVTTGGAFTQTAVTPTTSGNYDWTHQGDGMYTIEIPASGGASINNDTEGFGWFTGLVTGVLPWRGPTIGFRAAAINNSLIDGTTIDVNLTAISDSAVSTTTAQLGVNVVQISGDSTSADNLESYTDGTTPQPVNITQLSGDATAADNAEAFFDGTGYAGTNNVIPTVTAVTNQVTANVTAISGSSTAADKLEASALVIITGAAATGTLSTTQMTTNLSEATDDHYNGRIVIWTSGVLIGQATDITDYAGSGGLITYSTITEAPSNGDTFIII